MNRRNLTLAIVFVSALAVVSTATALETDSGSFHLELHETTGRFTLSAITEKGPVPLFVADDPTTSYISVLSANRIYRLGNSYEYRQSAELTNTGGKFTWTSSKLRIVADMNISAATNAVLNITLTNTSETNLSVGLRMLLDTYLGEGSTHFLTPSGPVTGETEYTTPPAYIASSDPNKASVYLLFGSGGATRPDRIVLANWKRLDDTSWSYTVNTNRNFSVLPYSVNDSAVSLYFDPAQLASGAERTIRVIFSLAPPAGTTSTSATSRTTSRTTSSTSTSSSSSAASTSSAATSSSIGSNAAAPSTGTSRDDIAQNLQTIDTLLDSIDRILQAGREPTDAEIEEIRAAIRELKDRQSGSE